MNCTKYHEVNEHLYKFRILSPLSDFKLCAPTLIACLVHSIQLWTRTKTIAAIRATVAWLDYEQISRRSLSFANLARATIRSRRVLWTGINQVHFRKRMSYSPPSAFHESWIYRCDLRVLAKIVRFYSVERTLEYSPRCAVKDSLESPTQQMTMQS